MTSTRIWLSHSIEEKTISPRSENTNNHLTATQHFWLSSQHKRWKFSTTINAESNHAKWKLETFFYCRSRPAEDTDLHGTIYLSLAYRRRSLMMNKDTTPSHTGRHYHFIWPQSGKLIMHTLARYPEQKLKHRNRTVGKSITFLCGMTPRAD